MLGGRNVHTEVVHDRSLDLTESLRGELGVGVEVRGLVPELPAVDGGMRGWDVLERGGITSLRAARHREHLLHGGGTEGVVLYEDPAVVRVVVPRRGGDVATVARGHYHDVLRRLGMRRDEGAVSRERVSEEEEEEEGGG